MSFLTKSTMCLMVGGLLVSPIIIADTAFAKPPGSNRAGGSKASPANKTRDQSKTMHKNVVKNQAAKVQNLSNRLNDFSHFMTVSKGLRSDTAAWRQVHKAINEHHAAKQQLNKLTQTSYANFAAARGYRVIPNPPTTAPPPLPPKQLTVSFKEVRKYPKSKRPPGGPTRR